MKPPVKIEWGDYLQRNPDQLIWTCICGCALFHVTMHGFECSDCAHVQSFDALDEPMQ